MLTPASRLPRATPIYVIGDSHAAAYDDRLVWMGKGIDRAFVFRALYCPALRASACLDDLGRLAQPVRAAMRFANLLVHTGDWFEAFHRTADPHWQAFAGAENRWPRQDPAIVFSVGALDVLDAVVSWPHDDAQPPGGLPAADAGRWPLTDAAAAAQTAAYVRERVEPLANALAQLRKLGFGNLALMSVVPPTRSDGAFRAIVARQDIVLGKRAQWLALRYKLLLHVNEALRAIANRTGARYVDRWQDQTEGGLVRRDVLNDNVHLTDAAADDSAAAIVTQVFGPALLERGAV
jgi:hypothetical protein